MTLLVNQSSLITVTFSQLLLLLLLRLSTVTAADVAQSIAHVASLCTASQSLREWRRTSQTWVAWHTS